MRVLISGATGLVGQALREALEARGDEVGALVRGAAHAPLDVRWDPAAGAIDDVSLAAASFDAVAHLAGEPLLGRWTDAKKDAIRSSRIDGTRLLASALAALDDEHRPSSLIVASAVGWYGDRGEELVSEDSHPGSTFLASVVTGWEQAAQPARDAGMRTVHMRMGVIQSTRGGALAEQLLPFRLGLGGRVGSGRQWMPWIGMHDCIRIWLAAIDDERLAGPVNVVGPTPARNVEHAKALGRVLRRPAKLPAPLPLLRARYGSQLVEEMLLQGQKVVPARLEGIDFAFDDRTILQTLRRELGR